MPPTIQSLGIDRLSNQDRLELIGDIWDSIEAIDDAEISELHRQELDLRLAATDADPAASNSWEEGRSRLREKK